MQKAPVYTPIVAASLPKTDSSSNAGGSTTNITTNITGVNLTSPSETASAVTNGIKYGTAVTVNTTTLAGIKKASATTSSVNTQTGVSNKIKAMGMNIL
jgi:hypothetical protein